MKISIDNKDIFTLSETQKAVLKNDVPSDIFEADMERRLEYILMHKYEQCFKRLKAEWEPKLAASGVESIPTNADSFAQLVFSQPNYLDRKAREQISEVE